MHTFHELVNIFLMLASQREDTISGQTDKHKDARGTICFATIKGKYVFIKYNEIMRKI